MFCLYCGNVLPEDALFCNKCGRRQNVVADTQELGSAILPTILTSLGNGQPLAQNVPVAQGTPQANTVTTAQDTSAAPGSSVPSQAPSSTFHVEPLYKGHIADSHAFDVQQVQSVDHQHAEKLESKSGPLVSEQPHPNQPQRIEPESIVSTEKKATGHISRRAVIAGLAGVVAVAGGLTWAIGSGTLKLPFLSSNSNIPVHPTSNANSNGTMFGYDLQRTHFNPSEHILNTETVSHLVPYWTVSVGKRELFGWFPSPIVANGLVFMASESDPKVYAFDAKTGATVWTTTAGGFRSPPAVADGVVYIGSGKLYALDAKTGVKLWEYTSGDSFDIDVSSPLVFNGVIYVGGKDHRLYALDAKTGVVFWTYAYSDCCERGGDEPSSPAVADGVIYVCSGGLNALSARTGMLLRSYTEGGYSSPSVVDGVVYVSGVAWDAKTGMKLWENPVGNESGDGQAVANGVVYMGSNDHKVYALDAKTGAALWTYTTGDSISFSPTIANGALYVSSDDGKLYAFHLPLQSA